MKRASITRCLPRGAGSVVYNQRPLEMENEYDE